MRAAYESSRLGRCAGSSHKAVAGSVQSEIGGDIDLRDYIAHALITLFYGQYDRDCVAAAAVGIGK